MTATDQTRPTDDLAPLIAAAWDEGVSAALTWVQRRDDADAAGQYVHVPEPRNPYRTTDPKESDRIGGVQR